MLNLLKKHSILLLCVLGSIVRLIYGIIYEPWESSPDHLAWELVIEQGHFDYSHLIHYPHEGGTILISILSHIVELFTSFSSLTIVAFLCDFVVRFIQLKVVQRIVSSEVAILFGLWTIFSSPIILPWGTANFGLHSISSVFPFLIAYMLFTYNSSIKYQLYGGAFLGLACWFSYSNIILVPLFFLFLVITQVRMRKWAYTLLGFSAIALLHVLVRMQTDAGFHFSDFGLFSIRGETFSLAEIDMAERVQDVPKVIANSLTALPHTEDYSSFFKLTVPILLIVAIVGLSISAWKKRTSWKFLFLIAVILSYFASYLFSPFFYPKESGYFVMYRHLTYIAPLLVLLIIMGFSTFRYRMIALSFIALFALQSSQVFTAEKTPKNEMITKASGWVLATKFGHSPEDLIEIVKANPDKRALLIEGIGWGTCTSLLQNHSDPNKQEVKAYIRELNALMESYPESYQPLLHSGIELAFSDGITPRLHRDFLEEYRKINVVSMKHNIMNDWKEKLILDDDELVTTYFSKVFNTEIAIRLIGTDDKVHSKQEQVLSRLINDETVWMEKAFNSIMNYYREVYPDYKLGLKIGGADAETIEEYLPKEINRKVLLRLIEPSEIFISHELNCSDGKFGFGLECSWDVEHGLGVLFDNWEVVDVGGMDVAFV